MTSLDVINGIKALVEAALPGEPVHTNRVREGFTRPASLVQAGELSVAPLDYAMRHCQLTVILTSFVEVDEYHDSHYASLVERQETLMGLFDENYVHIDERCPHVEELKASFGLDYTEVKAMLSWDEIREAPSAQPAQHYTLSNKGAD